MKPEFNYRGTDGDIEVLIELYIDELEGFLRMYSGIEEREDFAQSSNYKFALEELLREIRNHSEISPSHVTEIFARRMGEYACKNIKTGYIFSIACDAARGILDCVTEDYD